VMPHVLRQFLFPAAQRIRRPRRLVGSAGRRGLCGLLIGAGRRGVEQLITLVGVGLFASMAAVSGVACGPIALVPKDPSR
jgi:hypothetical protein